MESANISGFRKQNADSTYNLRIPLAICGFHLQFANSTCSLRIPLTLAESAAAQCNYRFVLLFVCGFHKFFWIPQKQLRIPQICMFLEQFWAVQCCKSLLVESKQQRISNKSINVADSATNLLLVCCGIRLQCTKCIVWPRNDCLEAIRVVAISQFILIVVEILKLIQFFSIFSYFLFLFPTLNAAAIKKVD